MQFIFFAEGSFFIIGLHFYFKQDTLFTDFPFPENYMNIAILKESYPRETRTAVLPDNVGKLIKKNAQVLIETGLGNAIGIDDSAYASIGAKIYDNRSDMLSEANLVLRLRKPALSDLDLLSEYSVHISYLDPFNEKEIIEACVQKKISAISMEMIPRITRAQKMDSLSSQASIAGYSAVILAAERLNKIFPMMMTPAGTISPTRVFIIGVGVAGLQAIATAKRLGARVDAFDTRPVVEEQVQSLGAKFVKIDLGETGQTKDGYAKSLTPEQLELQRQGMAKVCANSDVVITTAQVFGRKAPVILTTDMIKQMKPGSLVIDMAVESGGNVECSRINEDAIINGVTTIGVSNFPTQAAYHASQMYSNNLYNFVDEFWHNDKNEFILDFDDEIIQGCLITHNGKIVNSKLSE